MTLLNLSAFAHKQKENSCLLQSIFDLMDLSLGGGHSTLDGVSIIWSCVPSFFILEGHGSMHTQTKSWAMLPSGRAFHPPSSVPRLRVGARNASSLDEFGYTLSSSPYPVDTVLKVLTMLREGTSGGDLNPLYRGNLRPRSSRFVLRSLLICDQPRLTGGALTMQSIPHRHRT